MAKKKYEEGLDGYDWYEGQPKWPLRRIVKVILYSVSALVWVLILWRLLSSSNAEYDKHLILLNDRASEIYPSQVSEVLRINSETEDKKQVSVVVLNPVYLKEAENLQFTARINGRTMPPGEGEFGYQFVLRESRDGENRYHPVSYYASESRSGYRYYRLCFEGIQLEGDVVYTFLVFPEDFAPETGEVAYPGGKAQFVFTIYHDETYCDSLKPREKDFKTVDEMK